MRIVFAILRGVLFVAFFVFLAISVDAGFQEIVVGGFGLVFVSVSVGLSLVSSQITNSNLALFRIILAVAGNIKDEYLKEEAESSKSVLTPLEDQYGKDRRILGIDSIFGIIIMALSVGLILKGALNS